MSLKIRPWTLDGSVISEVHSGIYTPQWFGGVRPNSIVADVGAHIGAFTVLAAQKAAIVYAFEPDAENFGLLRENVKRLGLDDRVTYENVAVLDQNGTVYLKHSRLNTGGHSIGDEGTPVPGIRLDDRLHSNLDFLKIDAEGSEVKVLKGAERLLRNNSVRIAAEVHSNNLLLHAMEYMASLEYTVAWVPYGLQYMFWAFRGRDIG